MPDAALLGLRPVVRRVSATQKDIISKFERSGSSSGSNPDSGASTPSSLISRSRTSSIKRTLPKAIKAKSDRDLALEGRILNWIESVTRERPLDRDDYDAFIRDGVVLSKLMTAIVFNSVPMEDIACRWGANPAKDRAEALIREMRRYGVTQLFDAEDLVELKNIPKVTQCLDQLLKLASSDQGNLLSSNPSQ